MHRLKLGEPGPRQRRDRLWESTCFEAFVATGSGGYLEFNFSPGGDWAAYRFAAYRRPDSEAVGIGAPDVHTERSSDLLSVMALIDAPELLRHGDPATLRVGLTAVIEDLDEIRTYWALRHTQPRPDFHDPAGFAWRLDPEPAAGIEMEIR